MDTVIAVRTDMGHVVWIRVADPVQAEAFHHTAIMTIVLRPVPHGVLGHVVNTAHLAHATLRVVSDYFLTTFQHGFHGQLPLDRAILCQRHARVKKNTFSMFRGGTTHYWCLEPCRDITKKRKRQTGGSRYRTRPDN